jgi:SPP1 family predicted phage head-tail adaptor
MIGLERPSIAARISRGMFQNPGPNVPSGTGYVQSWTDLPPAAFAQITAATQAALEQLAAGTVLSQATHIVSVPYRTGLTTKSRFLIDGRTLNIVGIVDPGERHVLLNLLCAEVVK